MLARFLLRAKANPAIAAALKLNWRGRARLVCRLMLDRRVPLCARLVLPLLVLYLLSPVDLIPDFIPVLGYLDDVLVLMLAVWTFTKLTPQGIVTEIAGEVAPEGYTKDGS